MAKAKVFFRFNGGNGGWQGPFGTGGSGDRDGNSAKHHAERQAWREAQKELQAWYDQRRGRLEGEGEVKIWVDQLVCPQCQLWMIAGVPRNLAKFEFKPKLIVEVANMGHAGVETLGLLKSAKATIV